MLGNLLLLKPVTTLFTTLMYSFFCLFFVQCMMVLVSSILLARLLNRRTRSRSHHDLAVTRLETSLIQ